MPICLLVTLSALAATPDIPTSSVSDPNYFIDPAETATVATPPIVAPEPEPEPEPEREPFMEEPGAPRIGDTLRPPAPPEPPPPPPPSTASKKPKRRKLPPEEHEWYGWQNLMVSIPGFAVAMIGIAAKSSLVAYAGASLYAIGPTAVHWSHGNFDYGFASLGMTVGAPAITTIGALYVGVVGTGGDGDFGKVALGGVILGAVIAISVDAGVFAWVTEELEVVPTVQMSGEVSTIGFGGRF